MTKKINLILFFLFLGVSTANLKAQSLCSINIMAYGQEKMSDDYLQNLSSFRWNYQEELAGAAKNLSSVLLGKVKDCGERPVILKAHGYAMSVLYYILGMGRRYAQLFPEHEYVKIYQKVTAVYSIAGAYRGTPLMDKICSGNTLTSISDVFGNKCIYAMTTSKVHHPFHSIHSPGVPVYLIASTYRGDDNGAISKILGSFNLSWEEYSIQEERNQSDGIIPLGSALACASTGPLIYKDSNCEKVNSIYFKDYRRSNSFGHFDLITSELGGMYDEK